MAFASSFLDLPVASQMRCCAGMYVCPIRNKHPTAGICSTHAKSCWLLAKSKCICNLAPLLSPLPPLPHSSISQAARRSGQLTPRCAEPVAAGRPIFDKLHKQQQVPIYRDHRCAAPSHTCLLRSAFMVKAVSRKTQMRGRGPEQFCREALITADSFSCSREQPG